MGEFLSERYKELLPYIPGEQPQDKEYIKLNTNESPFPPSKKVIRAISNKELNKLNLYSDPTASKLITKIANFYKMESENVFVGNGSDEVLAFIFNAFCDKNKGMACPEISYGFYPVYCQLFNLEYKAIKLNTDFSIDIKNYEKVKENITIANPNAQTGIYLPLKDIESLLLQDRTRLVIIDEAYCDFGGESAVKLLEKYNNLIIVSTLSKSRQLAGARIGFALASKDIIEDLNKMKFSFNPYNINRLSIIAGAVAFAHTDYFNETRNKIISNREFLKTELIKLGFEVTNSLANFVLVKKEKISGKNLYLKLKEKGVLVRFLNDKALEDYVRITIGSLKQMQICLAKIKEIIKEMQL